MQFDLKKTNTKYILNMNTPIENLEEIETVFLLNKQDNDIVLELLTKLQGCKALPKYT